MKIIKLASILSIAGIARSATAFNPVRPSFGRTFNTRTALAMASPIDNLFALLKGGKTGLVKSLAGEYDADEIQSRMNSLITESPVLMLSFTTCPFCIKAKAVLDEKGAKYTVLELDKDEDGKAIRAEMGEMLGRTSVPAIWIEGTFIGGCNDGPMGGINTLNDSNKLDDMLVSAGAI